MDLRLKECKRNIRLFLRTAYSDERLAWLLAHARSGKLVYQSCCCLIGLATADHVLRGKTPVRQLLKSHYALAKMFLGAEEAELGFRDLASIGRSRFSSADDARRRRLIPMIQAEVRRRAKERAERQVERTMLARPEWKQPEPALSMHPLSDFVRGARPCSPGADRNGPATVVMFK